MSGLCPIRVIRKYFSIRLRLTEAVMRGSLREAMSVTSACNFRTTRDADGASISCRSMKRVNMLTMSAAGRDRAIFTGHRCRGGPGELVAGGKQVWHGLGRIQNGRMLAARSTCTLPEEYFIIDVRTGNMEKVLQSAEDWIRDTEIRETYDFFFDTEDGSDRVHAFITPPYGMEAGRKYPVLVYVHGGPHPFYTYGFTPEHLAFAAEGYGVLCCNPRGSSGYGWEHQDFALAMDGHAFNDIIQMVDEACSR